MARMSPPVRAHNGARGQPRPLPIGPLCRGAAPLTTVVIGAHRVDGGDSAAAADAVRMETVSACCSLATALVEAVDRVLPHVSVRL